MSDEHPPPRALPATSPLPGRRGPVPLLRPVAQTPPHPHPRHGLPRLRNDPRFPVLEARPRRDGGPPQGGNPMTTTIGNPTTTGRRWAYTGIILGGLVSVAANVAHSFIPPHD